MKEKLKNFRWGYVILFAILVAIGVLSFIFHDMLVYIVLSMGIIMTLFGIGYGIYTLARKDRGPRFAFGIVITVCSIVAGVLTMIFCKSGIEVLTSILGLFFIIDGSFKLQTTAMSKRYRSAIWWVLLVPAVITIIGGFLTIKYSPEGNGDNFTLIAVLLGITSIIDGISNLLSAFFTERNDKAEVKKLLDELKADSTPDESDAVSKATDNAENDALTKDEDAEVAKSDEPKADEPKADEPKADESASENSDNTDAKTDDTNGSDEFKITIPIITE